MWFKRSTAVTLAAVVMTLGSSGPAVAMPVRDAGPDATAAPMVVTPADSPRGDAGIGGLTVALLSAGALVAGAAAGFGGAQVAAGRVPLHRH